MLKKGSKRGSIHAYIVRVWYYGSFHGRVSQIFRTRLAAIDDIIIHCILLLTNPVLFRFFGLSPFVCRCHPILSTLSLQQPHSKKTRLVDSMTSGGTSVGSNASSSSGSGLTAAFREKVKEMQAWKPGSIPSNRDKLELYAYHKVAVSGDAPPSIPSTANAAERAKYQAWRAKSGKSKQDAMKLYLQEADRQLKIYGSTVAPIPRTPQTTPMVSTPQSTTNSSSTPRGLAAIPLLCAAAAESRRAYLQRLGQTSLETAWWVRQEPLCAPSGSPLAIPESLLLSAARFLEHITLTTTPGKNLVASFCWPLHKCFLVLWMLVILYVTVLKTCGNLLAILVWGSRRTGLSLSREWGEILPMVADSVTILCEPHQPLTARLVGLVLLPACYWFGCLHELLSNETLASFSVLVSLGATWWYWWLTVPFLVGSLLCTAFGVGFCFVLIEFAGV